MNSFDKLRAILVMEIGQNLEAPIVERILKQFFDSAPFLPQEGK